MDGCADNPLQVGRQDDRAVHLRQFPQPGGGELDVQLETARADAFDRLVVTKYDQTAGMAAQDALKSVPERGARGDSGQCRPEGVIPGWSCHLAPSVSGRPALVMVSGRLLCHAAPAML